MFKLFAVVNMFEKTPRVYEGVAHTPFRVPREITFHLSEKLKISTKDAWDNFDNTGKNIFRILKNKVKYQISS